MNRNQFAWREGIALVLAILIIVLMNRYIHSTEVKWMMMAGFSAGLTLRGKPFPEAVYFTVTMMIGMGLAGLLTEWPVVGLYVVTPLVFVVAGSVSAPLMYIFLVFMIIAIVEPAATPQLVNERIMNVGAGCVVGYLAVYFILPVDLGMRFREGLVPVLDALLQLMLHIEKRVLQYQEPDQTVEKSELSVERMMMNPEGLYPSWVYAPGFNPALRVGFQYVLTKTEQLTELLFGFNNIIERINYRSLPGTVLRDAQAALAVNADMLKAVQGYLKRGELKLEQDNLNDDIIQLENDVRQYLPSSIELMDASLQYIDLVALIYAIRDMRNILLEMLGSIA